MMVTYICHGSVSGIEVLSPLRSASVYLVFHIAVDLKQLQAGVTIHTDQEIRQLIPAAAEFVPPVATASDKHHH